MQKSLIVAIAALLAVTLIAMPVLAADNVSNKKAPDANRVPTNSGVPQWIYSNSPLDIETILVVDDDGGPSNNSGYADVQTAYFDALDAAGYNYDIYTVDWSVSSTTNGPSYTEMAAYDLVIWFTGETWEPGTTVTSTDETNLGQYLDGGGNLFMSAQDYFYDAYNSAGAFSAGQFPYDYLGVTNAVQDNWGLPFSTTGVTGSFAEGMTFSCVNPYSLNTLYPDDLTLAGTGLLAISGGNAATQYETSSFVVVFTTLSLAGLVDGTSPNTKAEFMDALITWIESTDVPSDENPATITGYKLDQNYPNPFNPSTEIRYQLPAQAKVTLTVYNVMGQEVATLVDMEQSQGVHHVTWNAADQPSGIYYYQLVTNGYEDVRKMVLMK